MIEKEVLYKLMIEEGKTQTEIAKILKTTQGNVSYFSRRYEIKKPKKPRKDYRPKNAFKIWKDKDKAKLERYYGTMSYHKIGKLLGRKATGIKSQLEKMDLGKAKDSDELITSSELSKALRREKGVIQRWIKKCGLPATFEVLTLKGRVYKIDIDKFWKWCEDNPRYMKWEKYERNSLGKEPEWLDATIKEYYKKSDGNKQKKWSKTDESFLMLWHKQGIGIDEIAKRLKRSDIAVNAKLSKILKKKGRIILTWKPIEIDILLKMKKQGIGNKKIADELGRSVSSIKQKYLRIEKEKNKHINLNL
jgi:transcriptional regulator